MLFQFILLKISSSLFFKLLLKVLVSFYWIITTKTQFSGTRTKIFFKTAPIHPKMPQDNPQIAHRPPQDHPKTAPRPPWDRPKTPQDHPQTTQRPPQNASWALSGRSWADIWKSSKNRCPKWPLWAPKSLPKWVQNPPKIIAKTRPQSQQKTLEFWHALQGSHANSELKLWPCNSWKSCSRLGKEHDFQKMYVFNKYKNEN